MDANIQAIINAAPKKQDTEQRFFMLFSTFITVKELKGLVLIPLFMFFFYAITELFFWVAAYDFMFSNGFTDAQMDDATTNSPIILGFTLFIIGFFNTATGYLVARYIKENLLKIALLTIVSLEVMSLLVGFILPADKNTNPTWQNILYYFVEWGAVLLGTWLFNQQLKRNNCSS